MLSNSNISKPKYSKHYKTLRPWIPPPGKSTKTSAKKLNQETSIQKTYPNKQNEFDTFQDLQCKITELDSFVKSLDFVLGGSNIVPETTDVSKKHHEFHDSTNVSKKHHEFHDSTNVSKKHHEFHETTNVSKKHHETKQFLEHSNLDINSLKDHIKIKQYKKKLKLLLQLIHISELETKKLRMLLDEKETALTYYIKDRDKLKLKLAESAEAKFEMESKLENITQRLIEIEKTQNKNEEINNDQIQIEILKREVEKFKEGNSTLEKTIFQKEIEIKNLKEKLQFQKNLKKVVPKSPDDKANNLEKLRNKVAILETQNSTFQKSLKLMEKQLTEANASILSLTSELNKKESSTQLKKSDNNQEYFITNSKEFQEEISGKQNILKISLLEENLRQKNEEIAKINSEKLKIQNEYELKLKDCERQLQISINTNRSLQNYLTHLKNSYAAVFSQNIL